MDRQKIKGTVIPSPSHSQGGRLGWGQFFRIQRESDDTLRLWAGFRVRRQRPIGDYIVDFVCLERCLVIESDGGQHLTSIEYDTARTSDLNTYGFRVIRFWNNQVLAEIDGVKEVILQALKR